MLPGKKTFLAYLHSIKVTNSSHQLQIKPLERKKAFETHQKLIEKHGEMHPFFFRRSRNQLKTYFTFCAGSNGVSPLLRKMWRMMNFPQQDIINNTEAKSTESASLWYGHKHKESENERQKPLRRQQRCLMCESIATDICKHPVL